MIGALIMLSASRIATDVWVNAAGLMMMPSAPLMPPWIQSMICASLFDWWNEMVSPRFSARARHISSTCFSVVAP